MSVDEVVLLYKGNLYWKQYLKSKRARFGIKMFALCDASRYTWNFSIYTGQEFYAVNVPGANDLSMSEKMVIDMVGSLAGEGYHVFCDNWFMSPRLGFYLLDLQTLCTGTLRKNRGAPRELVRRHQEKHESTFYRKREAVVVRFTDKTAGKPAKDVYVLSRAAACHVTQRTRHLRGSAVEEFHIPSVIDQYNGMNGVDLSDQSLHEYNIARKQYRWFKKLGLHLLHRMLFNAFLLFGREERSNMRFLNFSMEAERHLTKVGEDGDRNDLVDNPKFHLRACLLLYFIGSKRFLQQMPRRSPKSVVGSAFDVQ